MINQQLFDFIKKEKELGMSKEDISSKLLANGWIIEDIEEGFKKVESTFIDTPIPPSVGEIIKERGDNFSREINGNVMSGKRVLKKLFKVLLIYLGFFLVFYFLSKFIFKSNDLLTFSFIGASFISVLIFFVLSIKSFNNKKNTFFLWLMLFLTFLMFSLSFLLRLINQVF